MSLTEDPSSSCVHTSAKPAVPEYVGQRFAVINLTSKYERRTGPQQTDTVDTVAGSEISLQVKPFTYTAAHCDVSQPAQSAAQRESSLEEYLFNASHVRDMGPECDISIMQLEPMTDAQSTFSSCNNSLLPVIPYCLRRDEASALYSRLNIVSHWGQPASTKDRKHYVRTSQLISAHRGPIWTAELSKDMAFFATAGQDGLVKIWKCFVKHKIIPDSSKQSPNDRQSVLDTSTLASAKGSEALPRNYEAPPKDCKSPCDNNVSPSNSFKISAHRLSKDSITELTNIISNQKNQVPTLTSVNEEENKDGDDGDDGDDSTSSLSDEKSYGIITTSISIHKDINSPESTSKFRPPKAQFSQLSQTISQQHSTPHNCDLPSGKLLKVVQTLSTNKQILDFPSAQSFSDNDATNTISFFLPAIRVFRGHAADVVSCSWSHSNFLATGSVDKTVKIWSPIRGSCLDILIHNSPVTCVLFHPTQERFLYTATSSGTLYQWDIIGRHKISWTAPQMITCIAFTKNKFSPSAGVIIAGTTHGKVYMLAANTLKPVFEFQVYTMQTKMQSFLHIPRVLALSVIEETNELLVSTSDAQIKQYCLLSMLQVKQYKGHAMSGISSASIPRTITLNHSRKPNCEEVGGNNCSHCVVTGDDKGSILLYFGGLHGKLSPCTSPVHSGNTSRQRKHTKPGTSIARGGDVVKSCLKINLPTKSVCTTINAIQKNKHITNIQHASEENAIVVTTADGEIMCIDI